MYKRMSLISWGLIIGGIVASTMGVQWGGGGGGVGA